MSSSYSFTDFFSHNYKTNKSIAELYKVRSFKDAHEISIKNVLDILYATAATFYFITHRLFNIQLCRVLYTVYIYVFKQYTSGCNRRGIEL